MGVIAFVGLEFAFLVYSGLRCLTFVGKNFEKVCELCHITLNKATISDDNGTITPGGVRIGK